MTAESLIGKQAGNYKLVERLGAGGMGEVYKGVHVAIGSKVAIKVLHATAARDRGLQERFNLEARAVNRIEHPGVVKVIDAGRLDNGRPYLVMELLDGGSLHELRKRGQLSWLEACRSVVAVLDALDAAHAVGVVHRDLKPANLFRTRDGRTVVLDFGIAKLMAPDAAVKLTHTGMAVGTPHYMAPEQCRGQKVTPATDVYAMGVTLFELVCGRRPFEDADDQSVMLAHLNKRPPPPRALVPEIPAALQEVILHALAKEADKRPPSAAAMRDALRAAIEGQVVVTPPAVLPPEALPVAELPHAGPPARAAAAPAPGKSPWARPEPVDDDLVTTNPRGRRPSQDAATKAASPARRAASPSPAGRAASPSPAGRAASPSPAGRAAEARDRHVVMAPVSERRVIPVTERDARTPDGVRAHRENSRRNVIFAIGAATIAIGLGLAIKFGTRDESRPAPPRVAVAPSDASSAKPTDNTVGAPGLPAGHPCQAVMNLAVEDASHDEVEKMRTDLTASCAAESWSALTIECVLATRQSLGVRNCVMTSSAMPFKQHMDCVALATVSIKPATDEQMANLRRVLVTRCSVDKWSQETIRCFVAISTVEGVSSCATTQTTEQRDEMIAELERVSAQEKASKAQAKPKPAPPKRTATLEVKSSPSGADIFLASEWLGRTPYRGAVVPGTVDITVQMRGCTSETRAIKPRDGEAYVLDVKLRCSDFDAPL